MTFQAQSEDEWGGLDGSSAWKGHPLSARVTEAGLIDWLTEGRQPRYTRFRKAQIKFIEDSMVLFYVATEGRLLSDRPVIFVKDNRFGEICALIRSIVPDLFPTTAFLEISPLSEASFYFSHDSTLETRQESFEVMCTAALYWAGIAENYQQGPSVRSAFSQISDSVIFSVLSGVSSGYSNLQLKFLTEAWKETHERSFNGNGMGISRDELEAFLLIQAAFSGSGTGHLSKESSMIAKFMRSHFISTGYSDDEDSNEIREFLGTPELAATTSKDPKSLIECQHIFPITKAFLIAYYCYRNSSIGSTWLSPLGEHALCPITRIFYGAILRMSAEEQGRCRAHSVFNKFVEQCRLSVHPSDTSRADCSAAELEGLPPSLVQYANCLSFSEDFMTMRLLGPATARMKMNTVT